MKRPTWFILGGLLVALLLAGVVSNFASGSPDGLDSASTQGLHGQRRTARSPAATAWPATARTTSWATARWPTTASAGIDNAYLSTGLSGVVGVLLTFAIGGGLFWLVRAAGRRPSRRPSATGAADADGRRRTRTRCYLDRDSPVHRLAARGEDRRRRVVFTIVVVATPREEFWAFGGYAVLIAVVAAAGPGARPAGCSTALADRAAVRAARVRCCRSSGTGERVTWLGLSLSVDGLYGALEHPRQGHPRRARLAAAGRHHHDARPDPRPGPAALPAGAHPDRHVHAALPRRAGRRGAADADRPALPRRRPALPVAGPRLRGRRRARCSCARSSAASGSTWRWCRAATRAACPRLARDRARPPPRSGPPRRCSRWPPPRSRRSRPCCDETRSSGDRWVRASAVAEAERPSLDVRGVTLRLPGRARRAARASTCPSARGERVALLGPNGAGKTTLVLHLNGILSGGAGSVAVGGLTVEPRPGDRWPRSAAGSASSSRTRTTSCSCPRSPRTSRSARPTWACAAPSWQPRVDEALAAVGHGRAPRPGAAPPVVRAAPAGGGGHRAGDAPGDPGARRAVVQPGPGRRRELAEILRALPVTLLMVTHDLPYALELCDRVGDPRRGPDRRRRRRRRSCSPTPTCSPGTGWSCRTASPSPRRSWPPRRSWANRGESIAEPPRYGHDRRESA